MKYSVVTMGGTVVESGLEEKEAKKIALEKGENMGNPCYFSVREDEVANRQESAPSFAELIERMKDEGSKAKADHEDGQVEAEGEASAWPRWNEVINEGGEGYQLIKPERGDGGVDLTQNAIDNHGAKAVYDAAIKRMEGNSKPLERVGLIAQNMGVAYEIQMQAHKQMSPEQQTKDYWDACSDE